MAFLLSGTIAYTSCSLSPRTWLTQESAYSSRSGAGVVRLLRGPRGGAIGIDACEFFSQGRLPDTEYRSGIRSAGIVSYGAEGDPSSTHERQQCSRDRTRHRKRSGDQRGVNGDEHPRPPGQHAGAPDSDTEEEKASRVGHRADVVHHLQRTGEDAVEYPYALRVAVEVRTAESGNDVGDDTQARQHQGDPEGAQYHGAQDRRPGPAVRQKG